MPTWIPTFVSQYWTDPTKRATLLRYVLGLIGYFIQSGKIPIPAWVYEYVSNPGFATALTGFLIAAGQTNVSHATRSGRMVADHPPTPSD